MKTLKTIDGDNLHELENHVLEGVARHTDGRLVACEIRLFRNDAKSDQPMIDDYLYLNAVADAVEGMKKMANWPGNIAGAPKTSTS